MQITWTRQFGPYELAVAVKVLKLLRRNRCTDVHFLAGGFVEAHVPMKDIGKLLTKLKQFPQKPTIP